MARMETMLPVIATSAGVVALAEIGDKTMLLALVLAARYRQPVAVLGGILLATLANHGLAAWAGVALAGLLAGPWFQAAVAIGFLAMAAWTLVPDKLDEAPQAAGTSHALIGTMVAFFVVEIGDKTQVATVALAARFQDVIAVTIGTTLGMMLANAPAVLLGEAIVARVPLRRVRMAAALLFAGLGILMLANLLFPDGSIPG
jgi:putative Ca2+/H+ antiporter (TMEM165/GDT1 family)